MTNQTSLLISPPPFNFEYKRGGPKKYIAMQYKRYYSPRYDKYVDINIGYPSDGATSAPDINSFAWWVHDKLCETGRWADGTRLTNWQCSTVLYDILRAEGRVVRDFWWLMGTFFMGGGEARKNGMLWLKQLS